MTLMSNGRSNIQLKLTFDGESANNRPLSIVIRLCVRVIQVREVVMTPQYKERLSRKGKGKLEDKEEEQANPVVPSINL